MIIARNCPTCGHHEIGYVDSENTFHRLKPGDRVQVLDSKIFEGLAPLASNMELNPDAIATSRMIVMDLAAWAPEPVKRNRILRLKYGVLVDREMATAGMSAGLYEIAYRQKLHRLIMEEKYTPLPVIFARFFGAPQLATGSPLEMVEALLEELEETRKPIELVRNWIIQKDEESLTPLIHSHSLSDLNDQTVDDLKFREELEQLTLEEFFEML
jgi:hypothetical protein